MENKPTVCISFEARDEAAALRVAAALRDAGMTVVLSSEGGAAAVEGCDLFLPIISDNTQTQSSGRFRNEWQRAAQRAEAMADDTSFLLPVVVDNTANREAKVPAIFRGRPWLRFEVWGSTSPLVARVEAMLERKTVAQAAGQAEQQAQAEAMARSAVRRMLKRLPPWVRRLRLVWVFTFVVLPGGLIAIRVQSGQAEQPTGPEVPVVTVQPAERAVRAGPPAAPAKSPSQPAADVPGPARNAPVATGGPPATYSQNNDIGASRPFVQIESAVVEPARSGVGGAWQAQPPVRRSGPPRRLPDEVSAAVLVDVGFAPNLRRDPALAATPAGTDEPGPVGEARPGDRPLVEEALNAMWTGHPAAARTLLEPHAGDWINTPAFTGPVALLLGLACADEATGDAPAQRAARQRAREFWLVALEQVLARRGSRPEDVHLALIEAEIRSLLGQEVGALAALQEFDDSVAGGKRGPQREHLIVWATLGDYTAVMNEVVARFRDGKERWTEVRDWLRYDRRFEAWRAAMRARESGAPQ